MSQKQDTAPNNNLPTIDDVENIQKSILNSSLLDDKLNNSKDMTSNHAPAAPVLTRENDKKYYDFL